MGQAKRYSKEFKRDVLELVQTSGKSIAELERELGVTPGLIYKWQQRYRVDEAVGTVAPSEEREAAAELIRLRRELALVTEERDILKKAIQIFSKEARP